MAEREQDRPHCQRNFYSGDDRPAQFTSNALTILEVPAILAETLVVNAATYQNEGSVPLHAIAFAGAEDVPGGGTYTYAFVSTDGIIGQWIAPRGGTLISQNPGLLLDETSEASIQWTNSADVGLALYQINSDYTWGWGVNVVSIQLQSASYGPNWGQPIQKQLGSTQIRSNAGDGQARP